MTATSDSLGVYISVPFCKAKCTYCNFASGVFGAGRMDAYVERVCAEIRGIRAQIARMGRQGSAAELTADVDTVFLGGGTPSLLSAEQTRRLFSTLRDEFPVAHAAERTLECAPGQLTGDTLEELLGQGMSRVSLGVQSFIDREAAAVGRLHTQQMCLQEIARLRAAGVTEINVDLIAGLPTQTASSWQESVAMAIASGVPHISIYMLEVDEDSRLGREVMAAGSRYGAEAVPSADQTAEWYADACGWLESAGVRQYEISNFARAGNCAATHGAALPGHHLPSHHSRHNVKYWRRQPYLGFGLDAHSMLRLNAPGADAASGSALRWANTDDLDSYLQRGGRWSTDNIHSAALALLPQPHQAEPYLDQPVAELVGREQGFEEALFLGLRMNEGVALDTLRPEFGAALVNGAIEAMREVEEAGLVELAGGRLRLTARGRMVSNEVFGRLLVGGAV